jgi:hypothetical protein
MVAMMNSSRGVSRGNVPAVHWFDGTVVIAAALVLQQDEEIDMGEDAPNEHIPPEDGTPKKATWLPGGEPEPETEAPVAPHHPDKPRGERQDGAGAAPPRAERNDTTPVGATAAARGGPKQGGGLSEDPFKAHRGDPATFATGAAQGSGAGAGGGGAGESEEPGADSAGGGGRERQR